MTTELPRVRSGASVIPAKSNHYGRYWNQPKRSEILLSDTKAYMSQATFDKLADYSRSFPSGAYAGKMWRMTMKDGVRHFLRWFSETNDPDAFDVHAIEIVIL